MADNFEEKSGLVETQTPWGKWGQTIEEVFIEIDVREGTKTKAIKIDIKPKSISISVEGKVLIKGELYGTVIADECIWTLEDKKLIQITIVKAIKDAANCWKSLLVNEYPVDPWTFSEMEKKLTLERFQRENPGFDFSKAEVSGNYQAGGPKIPGR